MTTLARGRLWNVVPTAVGSDDDDGTVDPRLLARLGVAFSAASPNLDSIVGMQKMFEVAVPKFALPELAGVQGMLDAAVPKFGAITHMQRLIDAEIPKFDTIFGVRKALGPVLPKFDAMFSAATLDLAFPKLDAITLTQMMPDVEVPKIGTMLGLQEVERLQELLASAIPKFDISALFGFEHVAEKLAPAIDIVGLSDLAQDVERVLPEIEFDRLPDLVSQDVLDWVASIELDLESATTVENIPDEVAGSQEDDIRNPLVEYLEAIQDWLFQAAAQLRAGIVKMNSAVDETNQEIGRYQNLVTNLLFLYLALHIICHLL
jgi:hypothetical protein